MGSSSVLTLRHNGCVQNIHILSFKGGKIDAFKWLECEADLTQKLINRINATLGKR